MAIIPDAIWLEHAVAMSHPQPDNRVIVAEGSLEQVIDVICELPPYDQTKVTISLPNRGAEPFGFDAAMIPVLIREWLGS